MGPKSLTLDADPNVTPMIDVMLVLLIVFMVMVVRVHRTIDVQLPQPPSSVTAPATSIILEILPGPRYRINQAEMVNVDLERRLAALYQGRPDKVIQIAGDPAVSYRQVAMAMDIARSAGVRVIGIVPRQVR